jgi:hypothetical protein
MMVSLEDVLKRKLYRATCPDPIELGEYQMGYLDRETREAIRLHLEDCPHCQAELATLRSYLKEVAADIEYHAAEQIKIWVAKRLPHGGHTGNTALLAQSFAVRGTIGDDLQRFTAGEDVEGATSIELALNTQTDPQQPGRKTLFGLLVGADLPAPLVATLWQEGEQVAHCEVDSFGNLVLSGLAPGLYDLVLTGEGLEIHFQGVKV